MSVTGFGGVRSLASDLDRRRVAATVLGALVISLYAAWMAADLAPRWLVALVVVLASGHVIYHAESQRKRAAYVALALAVLLALTPVFVVLPDVLSADVYGVGRFRLAFVVGKLVLVLPFAMLATVVGYVGLRLDE